MKISVRKIDNTLYPVGSHSLDELKHMSDGEYMANITMHRNVKFHRLAFSLMKTIFDNQDYFEDFNIFRKYLTMKSGYVDIIETPKGTLFLPESLAFEKMDQDKFEKFYQSVITFAVKEYGHDENTLNQLLSYA